jgi:hypothetical protein
LPGLLSFQFQVHAFEFDGEFGEHGGAEIPHPQQVLWGVVEQLFECDNTVMLQDVFDAGADELIAEMHVFNQHL